MSTIRLAAVQAAPVFHDLDATIEKACGLIREAAAAGASLVVFPEAFVPGYPLWAWFIPAGQTHPLRALYAEYHANSVTVPGAAVTRLAEAAAAAGTAVAMGVSERNVEASDGSLFNTLLVFDAAGSLVGRHRKLVPTAGERLVWAPGDGSDLAVWPLGFARVGGLICWENYMPLARFALAAWGEQIHVAPTWDRGEPWISSMRHIAKENRCFVVSCCQAFHRDHIPDRLEFKHRHLGDVGEWINPGHSLIANPDGRIVAGPAEAGEVILYADVAPGELVGPRWQLDIAGHYGRPDVFELRVNRRPRPHVHDGPGPHAAASDSIVEPPTP